MKKAWAPMMCVNPYVGSSGSPYGCGQCMPCRMNKRRIWVHRIMLESMQYSDNCFLTLTYDDEHVPADGSLVPKDYQDFLKRLRGKVAPERFRFYLVGEYGDQTNRPHYHAALFGFKTCISGDTRLYCIKNPCVQCALVRDTWGLGHVMLGRLEDDSAGYLAGYVTKKMTRKDDVRLNGRYPEFGRMSLKPGIGYDALWEIASTLLRYELDGLPDVPNELRHGVKLLPLGRYLRRRLRTMVGKDEGISQEAFTELAYEVLAMRMAALDAGEVSFKKYVMDQNAGKVAGMLAREKIYQKGKSL